MLIHYHFFFLLFSILIAFLKNTTPDAYKEKLGSTVCKTWKSVLHRRYQVHHLSTQFVSSSIQVLTGALSVLWSSLVDIKDSGDIDLHGMKVVPNQCPQLKLSWMSGLHQLTTKITLVISDYYHENIILLTIFFSFWNSPFKEKEHQFSGIYICNIRFHRFLNSWTMNPTITVSED